MFEKKLLKWLHSKIPLVNVSLKSNDENLQLVPLKISFWYVPSKMAYCISRYERPSEKLKPHLKSAWKSTDENPLLTSVVLLLFKYLQIT